MTLTELLATLSLKGAELSADGERLRCKAAPGVLTEELRSALAAHKSDLLAMLNRSRSEAPAEPIPVRERNGPLPLSLAQEEIWLSDRLSPAQQARTIAAAFRLKGELSVPALLRAIQSVVVRHEVLRTRITEAGPPAQSAVEPGPVELPVVSLEDLSGTEQQAALRRAAESAADEPFTSDGPLIRFRLFELSAEEHVLHIAAHHIIFDVWSTWILAREIGAFYEADIAANPLRLPPLPFQFADFAAWQRQRRAPDDTDSGDALYWRQALDGAPPALALPTDRPHGRQAHSRNARIPFSIPGDVAAGLREASKKSGVTMFMNLQAALATVLQRWSGQDDILIGSPVSGRSRVDTGAMIGSFAYPIVLRTNLNGAMTLRDLLQRVRDNTLEAYRHQELPFSRVVELSNVRRDPSRTPLFQVMFTFPPALDPIVAGGLEIVPLEELHSARVDYELFLAAVDHGTAGISGVLTYDAGLYDSETAERFLAGFSSVLRTIASNVDATLVSLDLDVLEPCRRRRVRVGGEPVDIETLECALLEEPAVEDVRIVCRYDSSGQVRLTAYVVSTIPVSALLPRIEERMRGRRVPDYWVPVATLPLASDGRVDDAALMALSALDEEACRRIESEMGPGTPVPTGAVVIHDYRPATPPLHVTDLIAVRPQPPGPAGSGTVEAQPVAAVARPPAYANGGPLRISPESPKTLTEALLRTARERPEAGLITIDSTGRDQFTPYPALLADARRILSGLRDRGLRAGDRVVLQIDTLDDHFRAFWACVLGGITPVTVAIAPSYAERNGVVNKLVNIWELLERPAVITSDRLVTAIGGLAGMIPMPALRLISVDDLKRSEAEGDIHPSQPDDLVFFQLTSGSTGVPKCIQETHRGIIAHILGGRLFNGYSEDDVTLNWLPVDHVVPILTVHLKDVYLGCQEVQVKSDWILADPLRWLDLIDRYRVTHTWAPNFGFKMVAERLRAAGDRSWDLGCVKRFMNAGEQVTLPVVRDFLTSTARFGVQERSMQPSFGMAEVCTCMTYANDFELDRGARWFTKSSLGGALQNGTPHDRESIGFVDLGPPVPGIEIRITDADNRVVPEATIGRFQIRGSSVTPGYLYNDAANRDAFVGDGWFNSGDIGFILDGRLTLTGREKEMIVVRGANFYCYEIEDVVNGIDGVEPTFSAACAVDDTASGTEGLAVFFVPQSGDPSTVSNIALIREIRSRVTSSLGIRPAAVVPLERRDFPKTTSGKIQRSQLRRDLQAGVWTAVLREIDLATGTANTVPDWFGVRTWVRRQIATLERIDGPVLVIGSGSLAQAVIGRLDSLGVPHVTVQDASSPRMAAEIRSSGAKAILDLTTAEGTASPDLVSATRSPLALARAVRELQWAGRLVVVSARSQAAGTADRPEPALGMLPALTRTIALEIPELNCRHVDLESGSGAERGADCVIQELASARKERESAWRGTRRFVPRIERLHWSAESRTERESPISVGGACVVTGGLGGVGSAVCGLLLREFQCRVLVLGRSQREACDSRLQQFFGAELASGQIRYEAADVADAGAVRNAVNAARAAWQVEFDGVFHLAGAFEDRLLVDETNETFASALRAKVDGARVLHELFEPRRHDVLFVSFSSVNGHFGGVRAGAYAAANRYLDTLALRQRADGWTRACSIGWSLWDDVGISRGYAARDLAVSRGYRVIGVEAGLTSLRAALDRMLPNMLVGLDFSRPHIRAHALEPDVRMQSVSIVREGAGAAVPDTMELHDDFGTSLVAAVKTVSELPRSTDGSIDREAVRLLCDPSGSARQRTAPRSVLEQQLSALWREILGLAEVGVNENFFDLGGHSILLYQMHSRIREVAGRDVDMLDLVRFPTIAALAATLERTETLDGAVDRGQSRASMRQAALGRRRAARSAGVEPVKP